MDYSFKQAQKMLNEVLVTSYHLRNPEKIPYIDKIILWLAKETKKEYSIVEKQDGIAVMDKNNGKQIYFFKNPEIDMD